MARQAGCEAMLSRRLMPGDVRDQVGEPIRARIPSLVLYNPLI